jgi:hypothetical protein
MPFKITESQCRMYLQFPMHNSSPGTNEPSCTFLPLILTPFVLPRSRIIALFLRRIIQQCLRDIFCELIWTSHSSCLPRSKMGLFKTILGPSDIATSCAVIMLDQREIYIINYSTLNESVKYLKIQFVQMYTSSVSNDLEWL